MKREDTIKVVKNLIKAIAIALAGIVTGYLLMLLAYMLPTEPMRENVSESVDIFDTEREYRRVIPGYISTQLDNYTDSWMVGNAIFTNEGQTVWKRALTCTRAEYGEGPLDALIKYANGETGYSNVTYARYWHGYLVFLKPLLLVFSYADLRVLNLILEMLLVAGVFAGLRQRGFIKEAYAYLVSVLFIMPVVVPLSIQFSVVFYIANIAALILVGKYESIAKKAGVCLYFQLIGMITSFCDLLTYPIASLGVPLVCLMLLEGNHGTLKTALSKVKDIVCVSVSWGFGYGIMWFGKWVLSTAVLGDNIIAEAFSQILMRSSNVQNGEAIDTVHIWLRNVEFFFEKPYMLVIAVCAAITIAFAVKNHKSIKEIIFNVVPLIIIACMPFIWYAFAGQHSYEHHWFTFRGLMVSVFALLCAVRCVLEGGSFKNGDSQ